VTWTKLGAEFNSECVLAGLSDAAYRTHCEAIGWLYEVEDTSCRIPKRLLGRFAGSSDAGIAIEQLTGIGFWKDAGAVWVVIHHAGVVRQSIAAQQDKRSRDAKAQHRHRRKVSADVSADVAAESVSAQSDRQTVGLKDHGGSKNHDQDQDQDQNHRRVGTRSVTTPARRGRTSTRSAANSENHRVHDGPDNDGSDAQQIPIPVTHKTQAADRNARTRGAS
jgi:hypothetical protein